MGLPAYCGNCQDRAPEMGGCMATSDCQPGLICQKYIDQVTMMPAGICSTANGGGGDPCLTQNDCRNPNHCDATGKCAAPVIKAAPCTAKSDCDFGLVCGGRCTTPTGLNGSCTGGEGDTGPGREPETPLCAKLGRAGPAHPLDRPLPPA